MKPTHRPRRHVGTVRAQCAMKVAHRNSNSAWKVARRLGDACAYRCPYCGKFHVGHLIGYLLKRQYQR